MSKPRYLQNSNVVMLLGRNNPPMFTPEYLTHVGVLDGDIIHEAISVIRFSKVQFGDGYLFEAVENRVSLHRHHQERLPQVTDQRILDIRLTDAAAKLASSIGMLQPQQLGINFRLIVPEATLSKLFNSSKAQGGSIPTAAVFSIESKGPGEPALNLTFSKVTLKMIRDQPDLLTPHGPIPEGAGEAAAGVIVDANYHSEFTHVPSDFDRAEIISKQIRERSELLANLNSTLENFEL